MLRHSWVVGALLVLTGCGLPPALTFATYAIDGISYLTTGKSVSDHAISEVAQRDCALWRVIKGDLVCKDFEKGKMKRAPILALFENSSPVTDPSFYHDWEKGQIAALVAAESERQAPGKDGIQMAIGPDPVLLPGELAALAPGLEGVATLAPAPSVEPLGFAAWMRAAPDGKAMPPRVVRQHRAGTAAVMSHRWAPVIETGRRAALDPKLGRAVKSGEKVVVIGSFRRVANARRTARTHGALSPTIVPARVKGRTYYRVVSRPLVAGELASLTRTLKRGGITGAWQARICGPGEAGPACISLSRTAL